MSAFHRAGNALLLCRPGREAAAVPRGSVWARPGAPLLQGVGCGIQYGTNHGPSIAAAASFPSSRGIHSTPSAPGQTSHGVVGSSSSVVTKPRRHSLFGLLATGSSDAGQSLGSRRGQPARYFATFGGANGGGAPLLSIVKPPASSRPPLPSLSPQQSTSSAAAHSSPRLPSAPPLHPPPPPLPSTSLRPPPLLNVGQTPLSPPFARGSFSGGAPSFPGTRHPNSGNNRSGNAATAQRPPLRDPSAAAAGSGGQGQPGTTNPAAAAAASPTSSATAAGSTVPAVTPPHAAAVTRPSFASSAFGGKTRSIGAGGASSTPPPRLSIQHVSPLSVVAPGGVRPRAPQSPSLLQPPSSGAAATTGGATAAAAKAQRIAAAAATSMSSAAQASVAAFAKIRQEFHVQQLRRQALLKATHEQRAVGGEGPRGAGAVGPGVIGAGMGVPPAGASASWGRSRLPGHALQGGSAARGDGSSPVGGRSRPLLPQAGQQQQQQPFVRGKRIRTAHFGMLRRVVRSVAKPVSTLQKRIDIDDETTVRMLAGRLGLKPARLCMKLEDVGESLRPDGLIDPEIAEFIVTELGHIPVLRTKRRDRVRTEPLGAEAAAAAGLPHRAPIVTIIGHVDHGKTTLMDALRGSNVAEREAGGITQGIAAFSVPMRALAAGVGDRRAPGGKKALAGASGGAAFKGKPAKPPAGPTATASAAGTAAPPSHVDIMTFLDTPGHALFASMRRRGAAATDIVVLVVDGKDGVMPQTKECVRLILDTEVPCVVAVTKCDLVDPAKACELVAKQLLALGLMTDVNGGEAPVVPISAKSGAGLAELKDAIALQAEMMDLRADGGEATPGEAVILDARIAKGQGFVVDAIVRWGRLRVGDVVVAGNEFGRVRAILTDATAAASMNSRLISGGAAAGGGGGAGKGGKEKGGAAASGAKKKGAPPAATAAAAADAEHDASSGLAGVEFALPGTPVRVLGLRGLPPAGADLLAVEDEERAKDVIAGRLRRAQAEGLKGVAAADAVRRATERKAYKDRRQRKLAYTTAVTRQKQRAALAKEGEPIPAHLVQETWEVAILQAGLDGQIDGFSSSGRKLRAQGGQQQDVTLSFAQARASLASQPAAVAAAAAAASLSPNQFGGGKAGLKRAAQAAARSANAAAAAVVAAAPSTTKAISVILRGDSAGTLLALADGLSRIPSATSEVDARVISSGVGEVTEKDVEFAALAGGILVAFNVRVAPGVLKAAERAGVTVVSDRVIYRVLDAVCDHLAGHMAPRAEEEVVATAVVKAVFDISAKGGAPGRRVAGCLVTDGTFAKAGMAEYRVTRDGEVLATTPSLSSLMHLKDKVETVASGTECGISLAGEWQAYAVGDRIVAMRSKSVKPKLVVRYD